MSEHFRLTADKDGRRLDVFLAEQAEIGSRNAAQRLIAEGHVTLDSKPLKSSYITRAGEVFELMLPEPETPEPAAQSIPLDVVYEDTEVIVINKPKGMVVHPSPGHSGGTLVNALLYHCGDSLSGVGGELRPGIVHRLDKDTSGLIIAAKNDRAHRSLSAQLKDRSLTRVYDALVCGVMREGAGTVALPIGRSRTDRKKMAVNAPNGRDAVTHWELIAAYRDISHIRCRLETGRTHQIRVHMAAIARPILGDEVYGGRASLKYGQTSQCLHASVLRFFHPSTGEPVELSAELPEYFKELLTKLEKMV